MGPQMQRLGTVGSEEDCPDLRHPEKNQPV